MTPATKSKAKAKAPVVSPVPAPAPKANGSALAEAKGAAILDAEIAAAKAKLEALGFQVKEKKDRASVNPDLLAELKAVVEKHGGVDAPANKATFVRARKDLWPITEEQRAYNRAAAQRRKEAAEG